jgi:hypothetical protein
MRREPAGLGIALKDNASVLAKAAAAVERRGRQGERLQALNRATGNGASVHPRSVRRPARIEQGCKPGGWPPSPVKPGLTGREKALCTQSGLLGRVDSLTR